MRFIQPYPQIDSELLVPPRRRVACAAPVQFVKYRFSHHATASGYDRLCDYVDAPTIRLSKPIYWLGETALRPFTLWQSKTRDRHSYSRYDSTMEIEVMRHMLTQRSQIYHFIYAEKNFRMCEKLAGKRGHKLVATVHLPKDHHLRLFEDHSRFRSFDFLISMDKQSVSWWEDITGRANVRWIPHGVDTDYFAPSVAVTAPRPFTVLFAGTHDRDLQSLDAVVGRLQAQAPDIRFLFVGGGAELRNIASGRPNVVQKTDLSDSDYKTALQQGDLLFLPLNASTVCNAALEALACGTPIVTTTGGIEDYLDDDCAVVTPHGDVDAMCQAILVQAGATEGKKLSSTAARRRAESFSWREVARMHVDLYTQVHGQ